MSGIKALPLLDVDMLRVVASMEDYRFYWRNPSVVAELPKEQREQIIEKFFELLEKDKEKNEEWRSKFMKARNQKLPQACGRGA